MLLNVLVGNVIKTNGSKESVLSQDIANTQVKDDVYTCEKGLDFQSMSCGDDVLKSVEGYVLCKRKERMCFPRGFYSGHLENLCPKRFAITAGI